MKKIFSSFIVFIFLFFSVVSPSFAVVSDALYFNSTDHVIVSNSTSIFSGLSVYSVCAWLYPDSVSGFHQVAGVDDVASNRVWGFIISDGVVGLYTFDSSGNYRRTLSSSAVISNDGWYHVCATFDYTTASNDKIYINGSSVSVTDSTTGAFTGMATSTENLWFGGMDYSGGVNFYSGSIDDFGIINSVISNTDVSNFYNSGTGAEIPADFSNILAVYRFNEGSGSTILDSSANGLDGTITGATYITGIVPEAEPEPSPTPSPSSTPSPSATPSGELSGQMDLIALGWVFMGIIVFTAGAFIGKDMFRR